MTWTDILDSEFTEGQPIRGITGVALRDNPEAIANGDPGAPKVQQNGLWQVTSGSNYFAAQDDGDGLVDVDVAGSSTQYVGHFVVSNPGTYVVRLTKYVHTNGASSRIQLRLNGSTVLDNSATGVGPISYTVPSALPGGQVWEIWGYSNSGSGNAFGITKVEIGTAGLPALAFIAG